MNEKLKIEFPLAIIGMGLSGTSVYKLLIAKGISKSLIACFDQDNKHDFSCEKELLNKFKPKTLIVSPGVSLTTPWIKSFSGQITSELEVASSFLTTEKIIAVTGSLGKSTSVSLLEAGLHSFQKTYFVGGNLGKPLADYVMNATIHRATWIVLELSSYQLENYKNLNPLISAITYFTPNHLERYKDLDQYYETKWTLVEKTNGTTVINSHSVDLVNFCKKKKNKNLIFSSSSDVTEEIDLLGLHNKENFALAKKISQLAGWPKESIEAMSKFKGLPHRLENLGKINGIQFVNDSKATTIESVLAAVRSLRGYAITHLLLGGRDKNLPWHQLQTLKNDSSIRFYFFGECASVAQSFSGLPGNQHKDLKSAVDSALSAAAPGDLILLSPAGSSLDEFKNFEDRGNYFAKYVKLYSPH